MTLAEILSLVIMHFTASYLIIPAEYLTVKPELDFGTIGRSIVYSVFFLVPIVILLSSNLPNETEADQNFIIAGAFYFLMASFIVSIIIRSIADPHIRECFFLGKMNKCLKHVAFSELLILVCIIIIYDALFVIQI